MKVKSLFPGAVGGTYLDTTAMAVGNTRAADVLAAAAEAWLDGVFDWVDAEAAGDDCRRLFAGLVGASPDHVALVGAASSAAGIIAAQLPPAHNNENIVVPALEFTSNLYSWM